MKHITHIVVILVALLAGGIYHSRAQGTATIAQQAYLKASNTGAGDWFGGPVAISGDTLVVGAAFEDGSATGVNGIPTDGTKDSGAAYVFVRTGTNWSQQAYLKASNTGTNDGFSPWRSQGTPSLSGRIRRTAVPLG